MDELKPFYKLLGIPEDTTRPTAYQFLGLNPVDAGALSWENVQAALASRKRLLRQNIPSREFLPVVSVLETKLERSAEALVERLNLGKDRHGSGPQVTTAPRQPPEPAVTSSPKTAPDTGARDVARPAEPAGNREAVPIDSRRFWLGCLRWVLVESRELYEQARRKDDLKAAAEALQMSLEALKLLHAGRDSPGERGPR